MPGFKVKAPNGKTYLVNAPEGATQKDIQQKVMEQHPDDFLIPTAKMDPADVKQLEKMVNDPNTSVDDIVQFARDAGNFTVDPNEIQTAREQAAAENGYIGINQPTPVQPKVEISQLPDPGAAAAFGQGLNLGLNKAFRSDSDRLMAMLAERGVPAAQKLSVKNEAQRAALDEQTRIYAATHPNWFAAGEAAPRMAAEAGITVPLAGGAASIIRGGAGLLGRAAPRAVPTLERLAAAVETGGLGTGRTAAETAALTTAQRGGQLATRMAGGAISGGIGAGVSGQDVAEGAKFGAALPVLGSVLTRITGRVFDIGNAPKYKAAEMIREALGEDIGSARAAFAELSPDDQRLARQALVEVGVEPDTYMALGADVEQLRPKQVRSKLEAQAAEREAALADVAGGRTATDTRAAAELARRQVSQAGQPQAESALSRANIAGEVVPEAEVMAARFRQQAEQQSGLARRMAFGADRAETALGQADDLGDAFNPEAVNRLRGQAGAMTQRGEQAAQEAIGLRAQAQDAEDVIAGLAAEGMQPLRVSPIVGRLRQMAAKPGTRADDLQRGTLKKLAAKLEGLADENGVIDARDLYQIRKTGINDIVERLMGSRVQPSSGTKERTSGLLTSIRPMIDDAIEQAGGTGWKDYLARTRQGFSAVNRQQLGAKAAQLAKEKPDEFTALMKGERPKVVEDIMGPGQYDIHGMALADPSRYQTLQRAAQQMESANRMAELAKSGTSTARELIMRETPRRTRQLTRMALSHVPGVRIAAEAGEEFLAGQMRPKIASALAESYMSPQNAMALMNSYPLSSQLAEGISKLPPAARNTMMNYLRSYAQNMVSGNGQ